MLAWIRQTGPREAARLIGRWPSEMQALAWGRGPRHPACALAAYARFLAGGKRWAVRTVTPEAAVQLRGRAYTHAALANHIGRCVAVLPSTPTTVLVQSLTPPAVIGLAHLVPEAE